MFEKENVCRKLYLASGFKVDCYRKSDFTIQIYDLVAAQTGNFFNGSKLANRVYKSDKNIHLIAALVGLTTWSSVVWLSSVLCTKVASAYFTRRKHPDIEGQSGIYRLRRNYVDPYVTAQSKLVKDFLDYNDKYILLATRSLTCCHLHLI